MPRNDYLLSPPRREQGRATKTAPAAGFDRNFSYASSCFFRLRTRRMLESQPPASPRCVSTQGGLLAFQVTTASCLDLGGNGSLYDHGAVRSDHLATGRSSPRRVFHTVAPGESRSSSACAQLVDVSSTFRARAVVLTDRVGRARSDTGTQTTSASQATTRTLVCWVSPRRNPALDAGAESTPLIGVPIVVRFSVRVRTWRCEEFRIHTETYRSSFGRTRGVRRRNESDDFYRSCSLSAAPSW